MPHSMAKKRNEKMSFKYIWIHKRKLNVWVLAQKTVKGIRKLENRFEKSNWWISSAVIEGLGKAEAQRHRINFQQTKIILQVLPWEMCVPRCDYCVMPAHIGLFNWWHLLRMFPWCYMVFYLLNYFLFHLCTSGSVLFLMDNCMDILLYSA